MIYRKGQRVLVQGITGKQGSFWTEKMAAMGTVIAGGVNPKRAGETFLGVPVFASAKDAMQEAPFDIARQYRRAGRRRTAPMDCQQRR
jgi:succinyl-CoA synthetase alpha subunit